MGQQLLEKQCSNGNELAADHDVPSKDPPKSKKPCVDTSILEGSLDQTATTDPSAIEPILVFTTLANKTTRVINDTIQTTAYISIENFSLNARQRPSRKRRAKSKATEITEKKRSSDNDHEYVLLGEALNEVAEVSDEEDVEIIKLPPVNTDDRDTDTEIGNDQELGEQVMSQVVEVAGKIEVQTSRRSSRVQKPQNKKSKDKMISVNCLKRNVKKEKASVLSTLANEELSSDEKVDSLVKSAEKLEENHCWKTTTENNEDKSLKWQWNLGQYQQDNFHKLNDECSGKLPVEVFDMLFNSSIRDLIIKESTNYAKSTHNDANFAMTENELKQYVAVLFLAGYHSLLQQRLY